jgi:hypothetical protein
VTPGGNFVLQSQHFNSGGLLGIDGGVFRYIKVANGLPVGFFTTANSLIGASGDRFASGGISWLGGERYLIRSPNALVDGFSEAGRLDIFDGAGSQGTGGVGFDFDPAGDFSVSTPALVAFLNSGGTLHLQASNDIVLPEGHSFSATAGSLFLEAGRSIDIRANLFVGGSLTLLGNSPNRNASFRDPGDGNITVTANTRPAIVAAGLLHAEAQNIILQGGSTADAVAAMIGAESATIFAHGSGLVRLQAGSGGSGFAPQSSPDVFRNFFNGPNQFGTAAAFILGGNLAVAADDIELIGGGSSGAFAALASFGEFTIETLRLKMEAGAGSNADAVLLGLGGVADITYSSCEGCVDLLGDPLFDATAQTGIYIAGLFQDPSIGAILAMLSQENEDDTAFDDEDDDENSEDEDSEGLQCP